MARSERLTVTLAQGTRPKLRRIASTMPGRASMARVIRAALETAHPSMIEEGLDAQAKPVPRKMKLGGYWGDPCSILLPGLGEAACPRELAARYAMVEAEALQTSHTVDFRWRRGYPRPLQPRDYSKDKNEQLKVRKIASCLRPGLLASTTEDALSGPPVLLPAGPVAGGNGRAQGIALAYREDNAAEYRAHLVERAAVWGLSPAQVKGMSAPVLVRVLLTNSSSNAALRQLGQDLNEQLSNSYEVAAAAVASSARVSDTLVAALGEIDPDVSWGSLLRKDKKLSRLVQEAVPTAQRAALFDKRGLLNEQGRTWLTWAILGKVLPDADTLDLLGASLRQALAYAAPSILALRSTGEGWQDWDVSRVLPQAVRVLSAMRDDGVGDVAQLQAPQLARWLEQAGAALPGQEEAFTLDTSTAILANVLKRKGGARQLQGGFRRYLATAQGRHQVGLFDETPAPVVALAQAFALSVPVSGGIEQRLTF